MNHAERLERMEKMIEEIHKALVDPTPKSEPRPAFQCAACGEVHHAMSEFSKSTALGGLGIDVGFYCRSCGSRCYPNEGHLPDSL